MRADIILLTFAYVLSQFFRAFLAVLAEVLERDIGAAPEALATASGFWFLSFAAMQIPIGWALDRVGPRLTSSVLLLIGGGGGAALFAMAQGPGMISAAMLLIGVGCAPVLMASYYIFARVYRPHVFATLAAVLLGVGSLGNLASALPTTWAVEMIGWRAALWVMAGISAATAAGLFVMVRDPGRAEGDHKGSVLSILKMPALWLIFPLTAVQYAPAAGIRGLWIGPYLSDVFGAAPGTVGNMTMIMGVAMIAGTFFFGPLDRVFGTRKWVIFGGNMAGLAALCLLIFLVPESLVLTIVLFSAIGFACATYPVVMAHGRSFFPDHLVGRGVTLMNLFSIGGVGVMQVATGQIFRAAEQGAQSAVEPYTVLFAFFAICLAVGLVIYLFAEDRTA
ncbi:MFS transporter [Rhodalgimonas zhirmunskyi]|uniref:MFS transporter n=1 Tax=Rhodalgimonas zhirmunskyi TaxID=2964767 RepID=A0AAJ1U6V9_9RHOB|nr:MFS transporter [Rhodoalgimonas zhirmunskyi]MDQ2094130.1 MFS transporter [Rhodoalgimonas zhirmunskyi]